MSDIRIGRRSRFIAVLQASFVLALLFFGQPTHAAEVTAPLMPQSTPPPMLPLIRDARFDAQPVNIGTQLKYSVPFTSLQQPDGQTIVVGTSCTTNDPNAYLVNSRCANIVLARYQLNGVLDPSFGQGGIVQFDVLARTHPVYGANQQAGSILLLGASLQRAANVIVGWRNITNSHLVLAKFDVSGNPDAAFGDDGLLSLAGVTEPTSLTAQANDQLIVSSSVMNRLQLNRINADGTLDARFGSNGSVMLPDFYTPYLPGQILIQPDARIVIANDGRLKRLMPDGAPDLTFGNQSVLEGLCTQTCFALTRMQAIQFGQQLLVIGLMSQSDGTGGGTYQGVALRRITSTGEIDTAFGSNGWLMVNTPGIGYTALEVLPDQRIVIFMPSPYQYLPGQGRVESITAARYLPNGNLDTSFGAQGLWTQDFGNAKSSVLAVESNSEGRMTLIGTAGPISSERSEFVLAQVNADGALNPGYGHQGLTYTSFARGSDEYPIGVRVQPDHKVIAMAVNTESEVYDTQQYHLLRYNANGSLDGTFGEGGIITMTVAGEPFQLHDVVLLADGLMMAAGRLGATATLLRYLPTGVLDNAFGESGVMRVTGVAAGSYMTDLNLRPDGSLLTRSEFALGGGIRPGTSIIMRLLPNGLPDATFGVLGRVTSTERIDDMQVMSDGTIFFANQQYSPGNLAVTALDEDGQLQSSFGEGGRWIYAAPSGAFSFCHDLKLMPQGDRLFVFTGLFFATSKGPFCWSGALVRLTRDGDLDTTFGSEGMLDTPYRRGGDGAVVTAEGLYVYQDITLSDCYPIDSCPIEHTDLWWYDTNGTPSTKTRVALPNPYGIIALPDTVDDVFVTQGLFRQDSVDINLIRLVPATQTIPVPVVLR